VVLCHSTADAPIILLLAVFGDGVYRRHLPGRLWGTVIDIGGNIGATAIDLAHRYPDLVVHSYEPNPATRDMLDINVRRNGLADRIVTFGEAVGRRDGTLRLWVDGPSLASTGCCLGPPFPGCAPLEVPLIGLERCLDRVDSEPIALLKIDAEGAEADILEGLDPSRLNCIENIALEYHNDLCPDAMQRCQAVIRKAGFHCEIIPTESQRGMVYGWRD